MTRIFDTNSCPRWRGELGSFCAATSVRLRRHVSPALARLPLLSDCSRVVILVRMHEVTRILSVVEHGDPHAVARLLPLVYEELRQLVART
jgi:hypothetical protein